MIHDATQPVSVWPVTGKGAFLPWKLSSSIYLGLSSLIHLECNRCTNSPGEGGRDATAPGLLDLAAAAETLTVVPDTFLLVVAESGGVAAPTVSVGAVTFLGNITVLYNTAS